MATDSCVTKTKKVHMSYTWTVEDVLYLRHEYKERLESTRFPSASGQPAYWTLSLYPRGSDEDYSYSTDLFTLYEEFSDQSELYDGKVELFLDLESFQGPDVHANWTLRLEDSNGKALGKPYSAVKTFGKKRRAFEESNPKRDKLFSVSRRALKKALEMSKDGALTIHCDITIYFDSFNVPGPSSQPGVKTK